MSFVKVTHMMWLAIAISVLIGISLFNFLSLQWMLMIYMTGAIAVGVVIFKEDSDVEQEWGAEEQTIRRPGYWGKYQVK
ncbi:MAG TPA: hypothetical protein V6D17_00370 [Candidatus Obscuribacterales bacterium]